MPTTTSTDRVSLYFKDGGSDKVYQAAIEPQGQGFIVNFAFGRRGSMLQSGNKTPIPVAYAAAKKIFDKLVREKTAKGYSRGDAGTPYSGSSHEPRSTGITPQLLNPIDEADVERFLTDDRYWMQEKFDGRRVLILKHPDQQITGINRRGLSIALPDPIVTAVAAVVAQTCLLDGEAVGDVFHCFDVLERDGLDLRTSPYSLRFNEAMDLTEGVDCDALRYADISVGTASKRKRLEQLRRAGKEGVVFKDRSAVYTPGRPASGGPQFKLKFTATASCIVAGTNGAKRSVKLELINGGRRVGVGSVTIPPNQPIPVAGRIAEVKYLYAYEGGSLYQPVFLGVRDDVSLNACTTSQLKLKATTTDGEGEDI